MNPSSCLPSFALIVFAITIVQAYVYIIPDAKHPDLEGHCYYDKLKLSVPINETRQLQGQCEQVSCFGEYVMEIIGCGSIAGGVGYNVTETDYSKSYPECCPHLVKG
uniref:Single domain-containing protein n=1 Tax=Anopheles atroparvus TaxID=41427 RepID=A0AAG5DRJ0_ANOAO